MTAENRPIFNPNSEVLRPFSSRDPRTLGDLTPQQRWQLKNKEAQLLARPRSGDAVTQRILEGRNIMWEIMEPEGVAQILQNASEELDLPASMFRSTDMEQSFEFLGGRTLIGLFKYVLRHPEREGQPVIPFLMKQVGIEATGQDIAHAMRIDRQIEWGHLPTTAVAELLELASQELYKPIHMLKNDDFNRSLKLLDGKTLGGLLNHFNSKKEREEKDPINFMFEQLGIEMDTFNKIRELGNVVFFEQASWEEIGDILRRVAEELGKPVSVITANEIVKHNVEFLDGRTIRDLFGRMKKDGVTMQTLAEKIGENIDVVDVIQNARDGRFIVWNRVPISVRRELLMVASEERGKSMAMLTLDDLKSGFNFLGGKSLAGLHNYINKQRRNSDNKDLSMPFLLQQVDVSITATDVIQGIRDNNVIYWDRIPADEIKRVVKKAAEEKGKPAGLLSTLDLVGKFDFLGGKTLGGLLQHYGRFPDNNLPPLLLMLKELDIQVTASDVIRGVKNKSIIRWERVPWSEIGKIIELMADELDITSEMIGNPELLQKYEFLGGNSIVGIQKYLTRHLEKEQSETTVSFLRKKTGIEDGLRPKRTSKLMYRALKIDEALGGLDLSDASSSIDRLLPAIHSISRLYANPFLEIETGEIESEAVIYAFDYREKNRPATGFAAGLNAHLEQYVRNLSRPRYKEQLLSTPVSDDGKRTLEDVISLQSDVEIEVEEVNGVLGEKMKLLTPQQQELVMKIAVDDMSIEGLSEEFGIDSEELQEMYYDCLSILRSEISETN